MLTINVTGVPVPQGSHKGFVVNGPRGPRAVVTNDNKKTRPWRQDITAAVVAAMADDGDFEPYAGPVAVHVSFHMPRPGYHFRTGKRANELKPNAPSYVDKKPDSDKLLRNVLDALTAAGVFRDDAQVAELSGVKVYADHTPGARITIAPLNSVAAATPSPVRDAAATVQEALL